MAGKSGVFPFSQICKIDTESVRGVGFKLIPSRATIKMTDASDATTEIIDAPDPFTTKITDCSLAPTNTGRVWCRVKADCSPIS